MTELLIDPSPRPIGADGLESAPLAFGCWRFAGHSTADAHRRIEVALEAGLNLIDTADIYGFDSSGEGFGEAERLLGAVLAKAPGLRDRMVLATKGGITPPQPYDSSAEYLLAACDASLGRLGVDVIDLYQVHRPDTYTHPAALAETLAGLRQVGKIREVGVSNFTIAQYDALAAHLPFPIATNQPQFSADHLEPIQNGTMDRMMRDGTTVLAWSPLAMGRLATGEPGPAGTPQAELIATLDRLAERESSDRAAIALAFVLAHPSRPVAIIGTQNLERIRQATLALEVQLDRNDVYDIIEASQGARLP